MKTSHHPTESPATKAPQDSGTENLSEDEKKALELKEHAEHETGQKREHLQKAAVKKTE